MNAAPFSAEEQFGLLRVALRVKLKREGLAADAVHLVEQGSAVQVLHRAPVAQVVEPSAEPVSLAA